MDRGDVLLQCVTLIHLEVEVFSEMAPPGCSRATADLISNPGVSVHWRAPWHVLSQDPGGLVIIS